MFCFVFSSSSYSYPIPSELLFVDETQDYIHKAMAASPLGVSSTKIFLGSDLAAASTKDICGEFATLKGSQRNQHNVGGFHQRKCHKWKYGKRLELQRKSLGLVWKWLTPPKCDLKLCLPFPRSLTSVTIHHCFRHHPHNSVVCRKLIRIYLPNLVPIQGKTELEFHLPGKYPYQYSTSNAVSPFAGVSLTSLEFRMLEVCDCLPSGKGGI